MEEVPEEKRPEAEPCSHCGKVHVGGLFDNVPKDRDPIDWLRERFGLAPLPRPNDDGANHA